MPSTDWPPGPLSPVYGWRAVLISLFLRRWARKHRKDKPFSLQTWWDLGKTMRGERPFRHRLWQAVLLDHREWEHRQAVKAKPLAVSVIPGQGAFVVHR